MAQLCHQAVHSLVEKMYLRGVIIDIELVKKLLATAEARLVGRAGDEEGEAYCKYGENL